MSILLICQRVFVFPYKVSMVNKVDFTITGENGLLFKGWRSCIFGIFFKIDNTLDIGWNWVLKLNKHDLNGCLSNARIRLFMSCKLFMLSARALLFLFDFVYHARQNILMMATSLLSVRFRLGPTSSPLGNNWILRSILEKKALKFYLLSLIHFKPYFLIDIMKT